jgi:hypothetical protein
VRDRKRFRGVRRTSSLISLELAVREELCLNKVKTLPSAGADAFSVAVCPQHGLFALSGILQCITTIFYIHGTQERYCIYLVRLRLARLCPRLISGEPYYQQTVSENSRGSEISRS